MIVDAGISGVQERIYIFSSTRRPLYKQDVLDSLCVPAGYVVHYRYEKQHVGNTIWKQAQKEAKPSGGPSVFQGLRGLVSFVDQATEKDPGSGKDRLVVKGFYPLRAISVRRIELDGPILHVHFALGEYVRYGEGDKETQGFYHTELSTVLGPSCPPNKYICLSSKRTRIEPAGRSPGQQAAAWVSLVKQLDDLEPFSASVFYRVTRFWPIEKPTSVERILRWGRRTWEGLVDAESKRLRAREIGLKEIRPLRSGYTLQSGRSYALELSFYRKAGTEDRIRGARLVPELDPTYFPFKPDAIEVRFRYDKYAIDLVTAALSEDALTRIKITLDEENEQKQQEAGSRPKGPASAPQPSFLIRLTYPRLRAHLGVIGFLIGSFLIGASSIVERFTEDIRLGLGLNLLGSAITTAMLFWLYRRLR